MAVLSEILHPVMVVSLPRTSIAPAIAEALLFVKLELETLVPSPAIFNAPAFLA